MHGPQGECLGALHYKMRAQFLPLSTTHPPARVCLSDMSVSSSFLETVCGAALVLPYDVHHVALVK